MTRPNGGTVLSIWQRDNGRCWICLHKVKKEEASRDHVTPRSVGGYDKGRNYRLAHKRCNYARGTLQEGIVRRVRGVLRSGAPAEEVRAAILVERRRILVNERERAAARARAVAR